MNPSRLFALWVMALVAWHASTARADATRIVVVAPDRPALAARLSAELSAMGLAPIASDALPRDLRELESLGTGENAGAVIWIPEGGPAVQIWIADRITGKTVLRVVDGDDDAVLAFAAIELFRASLLEISLDTSHGETPATEVISELARGPARRGWLTFEGGILAHIDGPSATGSAGLALGGQILPWLELGGRIEMAPLALVIAEGAEARVHLGRLGARMLLVLSASQSLQLLGGVEIDLAAVVAEGASPPGLTLRTEWGLSAALGGIIGARLAADPIGLELQVSVGALVPPVDVAFFGHSVANVGRPMVGARAGVFVPL